MPKPLSPRSRAKLLPLINILTCIECDRPCTGFPHDDGGRSYNYVCPCGALYNFHFRRNNWRWFMVVGFETPGHRWMTIYEPWECKTTFFPLTVSGKIDLKEFPGYVHYERFANLLAFA